MTADSEGSASVNIQASGPLPGICLFWGGDRPHQWQQPKGHSPLQSNQAQTKTRDSTRVSTCIQRTSCHNCCPGAADAGPLVLTGLDSWSGWSKDKNRRTSTVWNIRQTSGFSFCPRRHNMPAGSVRLQSIKKLGQENHSYEGSDEGNHQFPGPRNGLVRAKILVQEWPGLDQWSILDQRSILD